MDLFICRSDSLRWTEFIYKSIGSFSTKLLLYCYFFHVLFCRNQTDWFLIRFTVGPPYFQHLIFFFYDGSMTYSKVR